MQRPHMHILTIYTDREKEKERAAKEELLKSKPSNKKRKKRLADTRIETGEKKKELEVEEGEGHRGTNMKRRK